MSSSRAMKGELPSWSCHSTQSLSTALGDTSEDVTALLISRYICVQVYMTCVIMTQIYAEKKFLLSFI